MSGPLTCKAALLALAEDQIVDAQLAHQVFECAAVEDYQLASTYVSTACRRGAADDAIRAYMATHHYQLPFKIVLQVLDALTIETDTSRFGSVLLPMYALSHCRQLESLAVDRMTCLTICGFNALSAVNAFATFTWLDDLQIQQQCSSPWWTINKEAAKLPLPTHGHNSLQRQAALNSKHSPVSCMQTWSFGSLSIAHGLACSGTQQHGAVCGACSADKTT